jgi:hypothetical protein
MRYIALLRLSFAIWITSGWKNFMIVKKTVMGIVLGGLNEPR